MDGAAATVRPGVPGPVSSRERQECPADRLRPAAERQDDQHASGPDPRKTEDADRRTARALRPAAAAGRAPIGPIQSRADAFGAGKLLRYATTSINSPTVRRSR